MYLSASLRLREEKTNKTRCNGGISSCRGNFFNPEKAPRVI